MTDDTRSSIQADLRRIADRLDGAPLAKVDAAAPDVRTCLQLLADAALGTEQRAAADEPRWRTVPELPIAALGDQVAVLGTDLVVAWSEVEDTDPVWTRGGRQPLAGVLTAVADRLRDLRRAL